MIRLLALLCIFSLVWSAEPLPPTSAISGNGVSGTAVAGTVMSPFAADFFNHQVHPIFVEHCNECHANGRAKGGLSMASLHEFLEGGNEGIVLIPGNVAKSALVPSIRWEAHDEELNMPPKKRMTDAEIETLTKWVDMGAPWALAESAAVDQAGKPASQPTVQPTAKAKPVFIGRLHPVIVHFPIACLLLTVLAEALVLLRGPTWRPLTAFLLIIGSTAALAAVISGSWLAQDMTAAIQRHQILGWVTLIGAAVSCGLLCLNRRWPLRVAILVTAAAAGLTGHLGGDLVYGSGWIF